VRGQDPPRWLMAREDEEVRIGEGYPYGQLSRAFVTALTHGDAETRERAERRVAQWRSVLSGMASGKLKIGSRTPVKDLPGWATPEVVRGGFATGAAAAEAGADGDLFEYYLTERGLAELHELLTSSAYEVRIPEEAALLTIAWLVGARDTTGAVALAEALRPHRERLRFTPTAAEPVPTDLSIVWRATADETGSALARRRPNPRVEAMREALTVWNPFADELLALWLETGDDVGSVFPAGWMERGSALLARYEALAAEHTHCTKHRKPKENLAILRLALREVVKDGRLSPRRLGLLRHAVDSMVARRGAPGSPRHAALRKVQAAEVSAPTHHGLARVVVARLADLPQRRGIDDPEAVLGPVDGTPIPHSIRSVVLRALTGTPEALIERGVVPSAEVLAELVPRIAAATVATAYPDGPLRSLMAANYEAFRRRRSLLLLDLEHQVTIDELPWVQAVAPYRREGEAAESATAAAVRLAELAIDAFPATLMPNNLVTEIDALAREAGLALPLLEELAADIFMGSFSAKFVQAAQLAGRLLAGSTYERYYGVDYAAVLAIDDLARGRRHAAATSATFDALCRNRAGRPDGRFSPAVNGMVIEQAQILTTHNLAAVTGPFGLGDAMTLDWAALARRCFERVMALAGRIDRGRWPLRRIKDLAYAWRQMVFFISRLDEPEQGAVLAWAEERLEACQADVVARLRPAVDGLAQVVAGGTLDGDAPGRRVLGWSVDRHWMLAAA